MEVKFKKTACPCLQKVISQVNCHEETMELRLPDGMPDIGKVLGCWGQILIRSKEWHGDSMKVSGGVMSWILYMPEEGTEPRNLEAWMPFQTKWEFPKTQTDGSIHIQPLLKSMDARSVSARKLMLRGNVSLLGEAYEQISPELYDGESHSEDLQLQQNTYFLELPREAGEKQCQVEEELEIPAGLPKLSKILRYDLTPKVTEEKIMAGRLVFKGHANLVLLYKTDEGQLCTWSAKVPFSQYADLDRDYEGHANARIQMILTGMELQQDEQLHLQVKSTMSAQYIIYEPVMTRLATDAYSLKHKLELGWEHVSLPVMLEHKKMQMSSAAAMNIGGNRIVDLCVYPDHPLLQRNGDELKLTVPCTAQVLYMDQEERLQSGVTRFEAETKMDSAYGNDTDAYLLGLNDCSCTNMPESTSVNVNLDLDVLTFAEQGLRMLTSLEVGEEKPADRDKPSLIVKRAGKRGLWEIAKECGSTVANIQIANGLTEEPDPDQYLLIPIS